MIGLKYLFFAILATGANLTAQFLSLKFYDDVLGLYVAIALGTLTGLVVKYVLDKKYIFYYTATGKKDEGRKFVLYSFTGAFTTFIFWGTELAFDYYLKIPSAKYMGAVTGLSIGYTIKFFMDKNLVFKKNG